MARRIKLIPRIKAVAASALTKPWIGRLIGASFSEKIPAFGLRIDTSEIAVQPSEKSKLFFGMYESAERRFVEKYLPLDADVVELGASIGVVTCVTRKRLPPAFRVVAVEANPALVPLVCRNLDLNRCSEGTIVEHAAIAYEETRVASFLAARHSTDGRIISDATAKSSLDGHSGVTLVPVLTLSQLLLKHHIEAFTLIADIEGAEHAIFAHEHEALTRARVLIIEFHDEPDGSSCEPLLERLTNAEHGSFKLVDRYGNVCVLEPRRQSGDRHNHSDSNLRRS